jgi:hypothetical protein
MRAVKQFLQSGSLPIFLVHLAAGLASPAAGTGRQQDDLVHRYFLLGNPDFSGKVPSSAAGEATIIAASPLVF